MDEPHLIPARSWPCNKELLIQLRKQKGWTQTDLARISGYSERLISKAESGGSLSQAALEVLAEALSSPEQLIRFEDLTCDPLKLAREFIQALYVHKKSAFEKVRYFLDDDAVFKMAGDPQVIPFAGEHRGIVAIERLFHIFFSVLEVPPDIDHMSNFEFISRGNEVIVWGVSWLHPVGHPLDKPMPFSNLIRFRHGKLFFLDDHFDTDQAKRVVEAAKNSLPN